MTKSSTLIPRLERGWRGTLHICFGLLCLRFLIAAAGTASPDVWPVIVLTAGSLGLSAWRPNAAMFAFTVSVPLLNGLGYVGLAELPAPMSLVFSGIFAGWILRQIAPRFVGRRSQVAGLKSYVESATHDPRLRKAVLVTDVLISVVLLSLAVQIAKHHDTAGFWPVFWKQPVFGFGDQFYFVTSAFLWLQGLFFFRMLCAAHIEISAWIKPIFAVYGITLAVFFLLQVSFNVPEYYDGHARVYFSPYEDISSFGSIAVAVFAFVVASQYKTSWPKMVFRYFWIIGLLALVVASWSRGAWLAGGLILLLVAWLRLSKRWIAALVGLGTIAVIILNANASRDTWNHNPYLWRLISLVRVENPANKSPDRFNLYHKAAGMIREHPFVGHGIGSTYLTSVRFARPGDPYADKPDFAHNVFLQIAVELGMPVAALFLALILFALWQGYRKSGARKKFQVPSAKFQDHGVGNPEAGEEKWKAKDRRASAETIGSPESGIQYHEYEMLGVTMALVAYLLTQMTANSLNVYVSNQFFFWFLMAALLSAVACRYPPSPSGLWRTREAQEVAK